MAGEASTAGANIGLDAMSGRATQTARTTYIALLTAAPTDASTLATMTELSATGYARQAATWGAPTGDPSATANTNLLTFGPFSTDPANVTHAALVSASSGTSGDFIFWWALDAAKDAASGESIQVAIGAATMTLD
jgi:hypothetical protein